MSDVGFRIVEFGMRNAGCESRIADCEEASVLAFDINNSTNCCLYP